ncbi:hypothetical protein AMJ71_08790 [candidate division TA06 bacterium SM1_40]|uniref:Peptidase M6-like domain-containing protein n=2 Tax=Bacteria division TA06 TaxID=1156500 RepID=A0A0S8JGD7_UNCT6|nr:MAG: hypothetical protein AMJ82_00475 [candidate division TA06 bacterium SM23_40]KPL07853.1 MAG: hypothetical protein AMJ71_08790 [candidate division TA06 bacterium SM1_40]
MRRSSLALCLSGILTLCVLGLSSAQVRSPAALDAADCALPAGLAEAIGDPARVRDARHLFSRDGEEWTPEDTAFERHFMLARLRLAREQGMLESIDQERLADMIRRAGLEGISVQALRQLLDGGPGTRGMVGYGFFFNEYSFYWMDITAIVQNMIIPRTPGGDVYTWLYNTTTNRSNLGVEAFISYHSQSDFHFKVYDWAHPSPWQIDMPYDDLDEYIYDVPNPDGVWRQLLRVVNITRQHEPNEWTNEVYLYNRFRDVWDLVYLYSYTTNHPTENTYEPGDFYGSWGPIFETFQDHDGSNKPIGFDNSWMYQDGVVSKLTPTNSYLRVDDPDLYPPIFVVPNAAWAVGSTEGEPANQVFEAEDGTHEIGHAFGQGWVATPGEGEGWMLRGPLWTLPEGRMNAEFLLGIAQVTGPDDAVCLVGVWDATISDYAASDILYRHDFVHRFYPHQFRYDFEAISGHQYEFVVYSYAHLAFGVDRVVIVKN